MTNLIGKRLDKYRIQSQLGEGGMATVYAATHEDTQEVYAIKVIRSDLMSVKLFVKRFEREAQTLTTLQHPHILKVIAYGRDKKTLFLVMPLLTGGNLADLLNAGALTFDRSTQIFQQIADALTYAHQQGVVHRDIKPQNVLFDGAGKGILSDFGLAR